MSHLTDTIRDRVYVALARALGDEAAAANPGESNLITVGTFDGLRVHIELNFSTFLLRDVEGHITGTMDVTRDRPMTSSMEAYRQAYQVALEAVQEKFLPAEDRGRHRVLPITDPDTRETIYTRVEPPRDEHES